VSALISVFLPDVCCPR